MPAGLTQVGLQFEVLCANYSFKCGTKAGLCEDNVGESPVNSTLNPTHAKISC